MVLHKGSVVIIVLFMRQKSYYDIYTELNYDITYKLYLMTEIKNGSRVRVK